MSDGHASLVVALRHLLDACGGTLIAVVDEGNGLWCIVRSPRCTHVALGREDAAADGFYRSEMAPRALDMRKGAKVSIQRLEGSHRYVAESFASIYMLVVWFEDAFSPDFVRARIRRALPEIESRILLMPPDGGPGRDAGAAKIRA